jgi:hypothetical protein
VRRHPQDSPSTDRACKVPRPRGLRYASVVFGALVCLIVTALSAGTAAAATSYENSGSFTQGSVGHPTAAAVDDLTGDVLVVDGERGSVLVFDDGGSSATQIGEIGAGELSSPYGIAVDQSNGDVYVSETGNARVVRYVRTGVAPPTYAVDPTYVSPPQGSGPGQVGSFSSPIAIDPTNGDLLIADTGNLEVSRFSGSGAFVGSFNGDGSEGGAFTGLLGLTVDSAGHVYVVDGQTEPFYENLTQSRIDKFSAAGAPEGLSEDIRSLTTPRSLAFDPKSGNLIVALQGEFDPATFQVLSSSALVIFHGGSFVGRVAYPESTLGSAAVGLAVDGGSSGRVYAPTTTTVVGIFGINSVQVFDPILVPELSIDPPGSIGPTSAHLSGRVDPAGQPTTAHFEYRIAGGAWTSTPVQEIGPGKEVAVTADIENLTPNSHYEARLAGSIGIHENATEPRGFDTALSAPGVVTGVATEVGDSTATVNGRINPFGLNSSYYFEYGTTTEYGRVSPVPPRVVGNGFAARAVAGALEGLAPGSVYHYRLVGVSSAGTAYGADATFTTLLTGAGRHRVYEQVSPVEKGLATIANNGFQALPDGNALMFTTDSTMNLPGAQSAPRQSRYVSRRGPDGWGLQERDPPMIPAPLTTLHLTIAISEDLTHALVVSNAALGPGAIEGGANLYIRDLSTGALTFVGAGSGPNAFGSFAGIGASGKFIGGTSNFSSIVFASLLPLTPNAPAEVASLYTWSEREGLSLASVMPNGEPASSALQVPNANGKENNLTSSDTARTLFALESGVFVREDNSRTVALSKSRVAGQPEQPQPGFAIWMSRDGSSALFSVQSSVPLTSDAPARDGDLYEYEFASNALRYLGNQEAGAEILSEDAAFAVSEEGEYVYLAVPSQLYVVHDGVTQPISSLDPISAGLARSISPNGQYLAFESAQQLTDYENEGHIEVYVYEAPNARVTCASCPSNGQASTGDAALPDSNQEQGKNSLPQAVTDDGTVFFDTASRLLPADTNGMRDVYAYQGGSVELISPGNAPFSAKFVAASPSGDDVFFKTAQGLVRQDDDQLFDVYDARVGGGIASQNATPTSSCSGEGCRSPAASAPEAADIGSQAGTGQASAKKHAKARPKKKHKARCVAKGHGAHHKCKKHRKGSKKKSSKRATRRQGR